MPSPKHAITGRPGVGKSTLVARLMETCEQIGVPYLAITTPEIRQGGVRVGFQLVRTAWDGHNKTVEGELMAHTKAISSPCQVGKYRVKTSVITRLAVNPLVAIMGKNGSEIIFLDEVGKMELLSQDFEALVFALLDINNLVFLTVGQNIDRGILARIREHPGVDFWELTNSNRVQLFKIFNEKISNFNSS